MGYTGPHTPIWLCKTYMGKFKNNWGCGQKYILGSVTSTDNDPKVKILNFMMLKSVRRNSDRFRSYSGF